MFAAFIMCTMLRCCWLRLLGRGFPSASVEESRLEPWIVTTVDYYNRVPSRSVSFWILLSVSPGLRYFQQLYRRGLLKLFVLHLLTIDSDAALVSSIFESTHSSNFEFRWLLPVWPFGELGIFPDARIVPAPNDLAIRNTVIKRLKKITL